MAPERTVAAEPKPAADSILGSAAPTFTREGLLAGNHARRAGTLLYAIENRSALLATRSRSAMARFETERTVAEREQAFFGALAEGRTPPRKPRIQDINRYALGWADLVPADPGLRAAVLRRIQDKYGLPSQAGEIRRVLTADAPALIEAYQRQNGVALGAPSAAPMPWRERLAWLRTSAAVRLESLPPFWLAYALTLTETVGGGILALPIALAEFGPVGAALLLLFFGIVNTITVAALVEAITRNGNMRYGNAFFGRLVGDYLGRPGNMLAMPALFALDAVGFLVSLVGFGITIGGVTGLPVAACAGALFLVVMAILWRGSLDATVALAVAVGLVNMGLIIALSVLSLAFARPDALSAGITIPSLDAGALELIFGVALIAFFGHTSAGHSAKVVLARDPGGKHLLAGNIAAMLSALALYVLFVFAVTGAVGSDALTGFNGTALTPLAKRVGPVVDVLGTLYVLLGVGLASIYGSLGLFNQTREILDGISARFASPTGSADRVTAYLLASSPLIAIFVIVVVLLGSGSISFTEPLSLVGTLVCPLLGGVFPVLLFVAARRRGERLPSRPIPLLGHPVVAIAVGAIFVSALAAFGLVIWTDPAPRFAAGIVTAAILVIIAVSVRRGAFRARTVVEYRVESGPPQLGIVSVVSQGRAQRADVVFTETTGPRAVTDSIAMTPMPGHVRNIRVRLPDGVAREVLLWVHAIAADGSSRPSAATAHLDGAAADATPSPATGGFKQLQLPAGTGGGSLTIAIGPGLPEAHVS